MSDGCKKCGNTTGIAVRFVSQGGELGTPKYLIGHDSGTYGHAPKKTTRDCLLRTCTTCGWWWTEEPLDSRPQDREPADGAIMLQGGAELISIERVRQMTDEGFGIDHDDAHREMELIYKGALPILAAYVGHSFHDSWKLVRRHRDNPRRLLVVGGALIAAEIDRLGRL